MNTEGTGETFFTSPHAEAGARQAVGRKREWYLLLIVLALIIALTAVLCMGTGFVQYFFSRQPLGADANTLYMADWSKGLGDWSGGSQWHWVELGVLSSEDESSPPVSSADFNPLLLAPYRPSVANIQVDAQIKVLGYGFRDETIFGIAVGFDNGGNGYACGLNWGRGIQGRPEDSAERVTQYVQGNAGADFSDYVTLTVKIRDDRMTVLINGGEFAEATVPSYQAGGFVGLYASNGAVEVRGFRVDKLA
jgi:hypothetical protein